MTNKKESRVFFNYLCFLLKSNNLQVWYSKNSTPHSLSATENKRTKWTANSKEDVFIDGGHVQKFDEW